MLKQNRCHKVDPDYVFGPLPQKTDLGHFRFSFSYKQKPIFRNSLRGVYRGVIISKTSKTLKSNRASNTRQVRFQNFEMFSKHIALLPKAVSYGVRIGTSTFSEFNQFSQVPITRKKF